MSTGIIEIMKRAAMEAMDNNQMCDLRCGRVVSTSPLKVQVTSQFTIPERLLVVPRHLTDYEATLSFNWNTELAGGHDHPEGVGSVSDHRHVVQSEQTKKITVHNALKVGDKIALIRATGGQTYYILDRI